MGEYDDIINLPHPEPIFSGILGDFAKNETDLHVRLHRLFDAIRGGASWYQTYKNEELATTL